MLVTVTLKCSVLPMFTVTPQCSVLFILTVTLKCSVLLMFTVTDPYRRSAMVMNIPGTRTASRQTDAAAITPAISTQCCTQDPSVNVNCHQTAAVVTSQVLFLCQEAACDSYFWYSLTRMFNTEDGGNTILRIFWNCTKSHNTRTVSTQLQHSRQNFSILLFQWRIIQYG